MTTTIDSLRLWADDARDMLRFIWYAEHRLKRGLGFNELTSDAYPHGIESKPFLNLREELGYIGIPKKQLKHKVLERLEQADFIRKDKDPIVKTKDQYWLKQKGRDEAWQWICKRDGGEIAERRAKELRSNGFEVVVDVSDILIAFASKSHPTTDFSSAKGFTFILHRNVATKPNQYRISAPFLFNMEVRLFLDGNQPLEYSRIFSSEDVLESASVIRKKFREAVEGKSVIVATYYPREMAAFLAQPSVALLKKENEVDFPTMNDANAVATQIAEIIHSSNEGEVDILAGFKSTYVLFRLSSAQTKAYHSASDYYRNVLKVSLPIMRNILFKMETGTTPELDVMLTKLFLEEAPIEDKYMYIGTKGFCYNYNPRKRQGLNRQVMEKRIPLEVAQRELVGRLMAGITQRSKEAETRLFM